MLRFNASKIIKKISAGNIDERISLQYLLFTITLKELNTGIERMILPNHNSNLSVIYTTINKVNGRLRK